MKKKELWGWIMVICMMITCIRMPTETMAALDDVYSHRIVDYGSIWKPILVDGYYCDLGYGHNTIYATECKSQVLEFPTVIPYNKKIYKIIEIAEKLEVTGGELYETYGYFPGYQNKDLVTKMMIPDGVQKVNLCTLHTWNNLKEIHIPASVIGKHLYLSHTNGKVVIDKENKKYKTSGNGVYTKDTKKLRATFGTKKTFTVKKGTKSVEWEAFLEYKKLRKITFPSSIKSVDIRTFNGCKNLKSITFQGKEAPSLGKKSDLKLYDINNEEDDHMELKDIPQKVTVYVKNNKVKKAIEKTLKIGNLKKLKWKVRVKK